VTLPANVRVNAQLPFPSLVYGTGPIAIGKANGIWTVGFSIAAFGSQVPQVANYPNDYLLGYDAHAGGFFKVSLTNLISSITPINILSFGAKGDCNGTSGNGTDNEQAFANAAAAGGLVYIPAGNYRLSIGTALTVANSGFVGDGPGRTIISIDNANGIGLNLSNSSNVYVGKLTLTRLVAATAGGNGIDITSGSQGTVIEFVEVDSHYVGMALGPTSYGEIGPKVTVQKCQSHGILMKSTAASGALQWQMTDILSQLNHGDGYHVAAGAAGPAGITLGDWLLCRSFANDGLGANFIGSASIPINGIRAQSCFMGEDGGDEWHLSTYGGEHVLTNCWGELAGTALTGPSLVSGPTSAATGSGKVLSFATLPPGIASGMGVTDLTATVITAGTTIASINTGANTVTLSANVTGGGVGSGDVIQFGTAPTNAGDGFDIDATNTDVSLVGCRSSGNSSYGVLAAPTVFEMIGGFALSNNVGVYLASTRARVIGVRSGNNSGTLQQYGIEVTASVVDGIIADNDVTSNATTNLTNSTTGSTLVIRDNDGYNPVGTSAAANVGASPATITAGPSPETHYLNQSATNTATIAKGSHQIATLAGASTYYIVELGPNESYVVTWATTQPTYTKDVH
jgi:hypothetical protein